MNILALFNVTNLPMYGSTVSHEWINKYLPGPEVIETPPVEKTIGIRRGSTSLIPSTKRIWPYTAIGCDVSSHPCNASQTCHGTNKHYFDFQYPSKNTQKDITTTNFFEVHPR